MTHSVVCVCSSRLHQVSTLVDRVARLETDAEAARANAAAHVDDAVAAAQHRADIDADAHARELAALRDSHAAALARLRSDLEADAEARQRDAEARHAHELERQKEADQAHFFRQVSNMQAAHAKVLHDVRISAAKLVEEHDTYVHNAGVPAVVAPWRAGWMLQEGRVYGMWHRSSLFVAKGEGGMVSSVCGGMFLAQGKIYCAAVCPVLCFMHDRPWRVCAGGWRRPSLSTCAHGCGVVPAAAFWSKVVAIAPRRCTPPGVRSSGCKPRS